MALIKCPECGKEISDASPACIHCGYPLQKKSEEVKVESRVIGHRGNENLLWFWILAVVFGAGSVAIGIIEILDILVLGIFSIVCGGLLIIIPIPQFIMIGVNNGNKKDCIFFNAETKQFEVYTLTGKPFKINTKDVIKIQASFSTDFRVILTYKTDTGKRKKLNLGYCSDRNYLVREVNKLREL